MNLIDKDNLVYLNKKPKLKSAIYGAVLGGLFVLFILIYASYAYLKFGGIGGENVYSPKYSFFAPTDAYARYTETYSFINGTDPMDLLTGRVANTTEYKPSGGIAPNGLILHTFLMPAFLPPFIAIWFYIFVLAAALFMSAFIVFKYTQQRSGIFIAIFCALIWLVNKNTVETFFLCNYAILTFAVILGLAFSDFFEKHPILGGILMGLAMVKAQMMVLMFLPFLMQKRFLSIGISVFVVLASIVIAGIHLDKSPILLITEYLDFGSSETKYAAKLAFFGIFHDIVNLFFEQPKILFKFSVLFFFSLAAIVIYIYRDANKVFLYLFLAIISALWGYAPSATTFPIIYILIIVPMMISIAKSRRVEKSKIIIYAGMFVLMFSYFSRSILGFDYDYLLFGSSLPRLYMLFVFLYLIYDFNKNKLWEYLECKFGRRVPRI